jgi:hypothetical protein
VRVSVELAVSRRPGIAKGRFEEAVREETCVKVVKRFAKNGFVIACICGIWRLDKELRVVVTVSLL